MKFSTFVPVALALMLVPVPAGVCAFGADMPYADAQAQIEKASVDAKVMGDVCAKLSATDQVNYLKAVNAAIAALPGSAEDKAAKFLTANRAALLNAKKGNLAALVAEMFATVDIAALPLIVETFSAELFNRAADASKTYTDAQYLAIAKEVVAQVQKRTQSDEKTCAPRTTFAILMFLKGNNAQSDELDAALIGLIADPASRELAKSDWVPAAMGRGVIKTYDPILGYVGELRLVAIEMNIAVPATLRLQSLLADLSGGQTVGQGTSGTFGAADAIAMGGTNPAGSLANASGADKARTMDRTKPWYPGGSRGGGTAPKSEPEPKPYNGQTLD